MTDNHDFKSILADKGKLTALSALAMACILYKLPDMRVLWNRAYPETPLTTDEEATLLFEGMMKSSKIKYHSPDDRTLIIDLLREAGFSRLAEIAEVEMGW